VSRKSVPFSMAARAAGSGRPPPDMVIDAHSDDWVSDRHAPGDEPSIPGLTLDLSAERGLMEVLVLSFAAPFALGWFWLIHAMAGRVRL
jgi:hypothetical protein